MNGSTRKVLVLNHFARPRHLPGGTRHVELFSRLDSWDARIIAGDKGLRGSDWYGRDGLLETVHTVPFSSNGLARILNWVSFAATSFARGVRTRPLHLVYGSSPHLLSALSAWAISRVRRTPFVLEIRDIWPKVLVDMGTMTPDAKLYRLLAALERFLHQRADHVVYMAEGVESHMIELGVTPAQMTFIPNGADASDFVASKARNDLRARYEFSGVVAIYAGAHGPANGLDFLLDAAKQMAGTVPLTIALVGDGIEKMRLVQRATEEQLENVRFMDPVPKNEIPDLLAAADIGVHCLADVELFHVGVSPNKLFDYMAAGLPVVTNTPGVCTEFVETSRGGLAVQPNGMRSALESLAILSEDERASIGARGRAYLEATRSRTAMAARLQRVLDEMVPSAQSGSKRPKEAS